ncbi:MAG: YraN family protein [Planctomycetota bacterium]|jgi:putative endonuclease
MWPLRRRQLPLGQRGERLAVRHLKRGGLTVLARNYRCPAGEVDVIALDRSTRREGAETIVFVEVKARSSDRYTDPESAVDADKQRRIRTVADYYLRRHHAEQYNVRFDIVAVVAGDGDPIIRHTPDAF